MWGRQIEELLVKSDYMIGVCDEMYGKVGGGWGKMGMEMGKGVEESNKTWQKGKDQSLREQQMYKRQVDVLEREISRMQVIRTKLQQQILSSKQSSDNGLSQWSRISSRKLRQMSSLEQQLSNSRRLLNGEMQSWNGLEMSLVEMRDGMGEFQRREVKLKRRISEIVDRERQYWVWRDMEGRYEQLVNQKRNLVALGQKLKEEKLSLIESKTYSIAQSNTNLQEMQRYYRQLSSLIKEQNIIIQEIHSRQESNNFNDRVQLKEEEDDGLFEREVLSLRKTIANRKFKQRSKLVDKQMGVGVDGGRNKDKMAEQQSGNAMAQIGEGQHQKRGQMMKQGINTNYKNNNQSIFKISVEPVSHPKNTHKPVPKEQNHRNSLPSKINQIAVSRQKHLQSEQKQKLQGDFDTLQIQTLERILKSKQEKIQSIFYEAKPNDLPVPLMVKTPQSQQKITNKVAKGSFHTQPIKVKDKEEDRIQMSPNSRFIQKMIQSGNQQTISRLRNNVRIRTKKTQGEKEKIIQRRMNCSILERKGSKLIALSPSRSQSKRQTIRTSQNSMNNIKPVEENGLNQSVSHKELLHNQQRQKNNEMLYDLGDERMRIEKVFRKIEEINKKYEQSHNEERKESTKAYQEKVKVYKLTGIRKNGNSLSSQRKGKAEAVESGSEELSKIEEEEQSVRNTMQTMTGRK